MAVKFTPEQQQAIDLHDCNILVSAAAGSGKTAVLSERIVKMVCREENPVDIDRLLVVTFTKAAAAEMRERISQAILKRLNEDGGNEHLQRQAAIIHNAQITTIDSFCLFVLRNNFEDIGLDPAFRIADEGEVELLSQDVMKEMLEEHFASGEERFFHTIEYFCPNGRESVLESHILQLYRYALSYPFPEKWLRERKKDYVYETVEDIAASDAGVFLFGHLQKLLAGVAEELKRAESICEEPDGPYMYGEVLEQEREAIEKIACAENLVRLSELLPAFMPGKFPGKKDDSVSAEKREQVKNLHDKIKNMVKKMQTSYFNLPFETVFRQAKTAAEAVESLVDLSLEFMERLKAKKTDKKLLDFSDMEHYALQILVEEDEEGNMVPTKTALEYRDYFEEVLIDEYQDSNLVQEYLLKAVAREEDGKKNRFMVGDVKQSIYKFRLARPELFLEKYDTYSLTDGENRKIDLHKNFRSRNEVIDTVNDVFSKIMQKELGGIVYDEEAALYAGAVYPENPGCESELLLIEKPEKEAELDARQTEALLIAAKIKELLAGFQVTDKETGALRPVRYKDIVVLLRTNSGWDESFKDTLASQGIPAYIEGKTGYFASKEIQDVLLFLKVLDNPLQDIPLYGVMKSVFGGFTEEEVAVLRSVEEKDEPLYENLRRHAEEKYAGFLAKIDRYREYATYMTILELLQTLFEEHDYLAYVSALPAGEKRLANAEMLLTKAAAYEKNSYYGLFHFIRYVEQLEKYDVDYGEAVTLDENADVVRIMSIHKSKGLEFPVAIVAGLSKKFNMQDAASSIIMDMDLGLGVDYVNTESRVKNKTLRKNILATKMKLDNLAEELRVLYVAMTRAREKLILTACTEKTEEKVQLGEDSRAETAGKGDGRPPLSYAELTSATSFLQFLLPVFSNIKVVTMEDLGLCAIKEEVDRESRKRRLLTDRTADAEALQKLTERFSFVYPYENLQNLYTKTTVSELKMAALEEKEETAELFPEKEVVPYVPDFMREKEKISGTTRGSAMHRLMELVDFTKNYANWQDVKAVMQDFLQEGRLSAEYEEAIRVDKILHFLQSPLAGRMRKAQENGKLFREQPFVYGVETKEGETVLIQGIVDAYFEEEDGIVLLDYKTDVVENGEELVKRYQTQIDYYEKALHNLTGKRMKECILYSFYLGCEVQL